MKKEKKSAIAAIEKQAQALKTMRIEYVPIDSVSPNAYNPNRQSEHDFALLLRSIEEDGFTQPIVCIRVTEEMKASGDESVAAYAAGQVVIVDGEHRWRAARQLGYSEIPVAIAPMSLTQARIGTLRHNRARGSEDIELATQVLRELQQLGAIDWAQDSLMLDDEELNRLLEDIPVPDALAADEHTEAWEPVPIDQSADLTGAGKERLGSVLSMTATASDRVRDQEKRIAEAKTMQERDAARKDMQVYRLVCVFAGEEAEVVRAILGDHQAEQLVALCKAEFERRQ